MGQNLIDCNLAYKQGETLSRLSEKIAGIDKTKLFLYCKLYKTINSTSDIDTQINQYLELLKAQKLDIVSIHSLDIIGTMSLIDIYKHLEILKNQGKINHIGICNVSLSQLISLIDANIQIETFEGVYSYYCKYYEESGVLEYCKNHDIRFLAYQTLLMGEFTEDEILNKLSKKYNKTIAQILLNYYVLHKKIIPIVKSSERKHIYENLTHDFYMDIDDYILLDSQNKNKKYTVNFDSGLDNKIYQLSYNMKKGE